MKRKSSERESRLGKGMREGDIAYVVRRVLEMKLPRKRKRERPKSRSKDVLKRDMKEMGVTDDDHLDEILPILFGSHLICMQFHLPRPIEFTINWLSQIPPIFTQLI